ESQCGGECEGNRERASYHVESFLRQRTPSMRSPWVGARPVSRSDAALGAAPLIDTKGGLAYGPGPLVDVRWMDPGPPWRTAAKRVPRPGDNTGIRVVCSRHPAQIVQAYDQSRGGGGIR